MTDTTQQSYVLHKTYNTNNSWFEFANFKRTNTPELTTYWAENNEYSDMVLRTAFHPKYLDEYKSVLTIKRYNLPGGIVQTTLELTPKASGTVQINNTSYNVVADEPFLVDIQDLISTTSGVITLDVTGFSYNDDPLQLYATGDHSPKLNVAYASSTQPAVIGVSLGTPPTRTAYLDGEPFNKEGLSAKIHFADGVYRFESEDLVCVPEILRSSDKAVTVMYGEYPYEQPVSVSEDNYYAETCKPDGEHGDNPKVNLATGRLLYTLPDASIGANSYTIDIFHVYSSQIPPSFQAKIVGMPNGWKLNAHQFVEKQASGRYLYFDATGYVHQFVLFDAERGRYNDTNGQGLVLTVGNHGCEIVDEAGNKLQFDTDGKLVASISCLNPQIRKVYEHDESGKLVRIYDARCLNQSTQSCRESIVLLYGSNGLLSAVFACENDEQKRGKLFTYTNGILTKQLLFAYNKSPEEFMQFAYLPKTNEDSNEQYLERVLEVKSGKQIVVGYDSGKRVSNVSWGYYDENSYTTHHLEKQSFAFAYNSNGSERVHNAVVINNKGVSMTYFVNRKGQIVSTFEGANGSFRTMSRESSKRIELEDNVSYTTINGFDCRKVFGKSYEVPVPEDFELARGLAEKTVRHFGCGFWLKHEESTDRLKVKLQYAFAKNGVVQNTMESETFVDGFASSCWQKVVLPMEAPSRDKDNDSIILHSLKIVLQNGQQEKVGAYYISSITFEPFPQTELFLSGEHPLKFKDCGFVKLADCNGSTIAVFDNFSTADLFMTEQDVLKTLFNQKFNTYKIGIDDCFDAVCNSGAKRIANVHKLHVYKIAQEWNDIQSQSPICSQMISVDDKTITTQTYTFFDGKDYCEAETKCESFPDGIGSDESTTSTILQRSNKYGQQLFQIDEYGKKTLYTYDEIGNLTKQEIIGEDGKKMCFEAQFDTHKEYLLTDTDGQAETQHQYVTPEAIVSSQSLFGVTQQVDFDNYMRHPQKISIFESATPQNKLENTFTYANDAVATVTNGVVKYGTAFNKATDTTTYSQFESLNSTLQTTLQTTQLLHNTDGSETLKTTYTRGTSQQDEFSTTVNKYGKIVSCADANETTAIYTYQDSNSCHANDLVAEIQDNLEHTKTQFFYNDDGSLAKWSKTNLADNSAVLDVHQIFQGDTKYTFGENEKYYSHVVYDTQHTMNPQIVSTGISRDKNTDNDDDVKEFAEFRRNYIYDSLGRLTAKQTQGPVEQSHSRQYLAVDNKETSLVSSDGYHLYNKIVMPSSYVETQGNIVHNYTFDAKQQITQIEANYNFLHTSTVIDAYTGTHIDYYPTCTKELTQQFQYDTFGRIVHETHSGMGVNNTYTYDTFGRLSSVASNGSTRTFAYNSLGRLESAGNTTFVYDMFGNRISSTTDGMSTNFTYVRGNLLAVVDSNILYEYNKDGARFQKTVDGVVTKYFLDGHRIMGENRGTNTIRYFYDIDGLCGIRYNGQNYNVVRDALGNVVAIIKDAQILARYEYDSLGNCKVYNLGNSTIGDVNPFRWKGHYFDTETGFYYINGRYYDPQTASFLDAESVSAVFADSDNPLALDRNGIACVNTFAFAINATNVFTHLEMFADINYDINANKPWWEIAWNAVVNWFAKTMHAITKWYDSIPNWLKWVVGIGVLAVLAIATVATGGASGGVVGFILAEALKGAAIGAVSSALSNGIIEGIKSAKTEEGFWSGFFDGAADGFMSGAIIGGITGAISGGVQVSRAASCWDKGTFSSKYKSMKHHYKEQVIKKGLQKGNSIVKYTNDAIRFADNNGLNFALNPSRNGLQNSWTLPRAFGSGMNGLYTASGKIITFHYFYKW